MAPDLRKHLGLSKVEYSVADFLKLEIRILKKGTLSCIIFLLPVSVAVTVFSNQYDQLALVLHVCGVDLCVRW